MSDYVYEKTLTTHQNDATDGTHSESNPAGGQDEIYISVSQHGTFLLSVCDNGHYVARGGQRATIIIDDPRVLAVALVQAIKAWASTWWAKYLGVTLPQ